MAPDTFDGTLRLPGHRPVPAELVVRTTIKATPKIRNVYYCGFSDSAPPPEFSKRRPVIVFSHKNALNGPILVVPITTRPQAQNAWASKLERNPTPGETCDVWAVCNHLYTVSCARLTATHGIVPRLTAEEFLPIHRLVLKWLPSLEMPLEGS